MILSGIANSSPSFRNLYCRVRMMLLVALPGLIASGISITRYTGLILSSIVWEVSRSAIMYILCLSILQYQSINLYICSRNLSLEELVHNVT